MPRRDDRINPPRAPRQLRVTAAGGRVVVERGDGHRREWDDVMVVAQDHKGVWVVAAAGDRLAADEAERDAAPTVGKDRRYRQVRRRSALSPDGFDAEVALAYLKYVIFASASDLPFWRRFRKPPLALDLHGFEAIPTAERERFEREVAEWGQPTLICGQPTRPPSTDWRIATLAGSSVVAIELAADGTLGPTARLGLVAVVVAIAVGLAVQWFRGRRRRNLR